jgi:hypothetical protein
MTNLLVPLLSILSVASPAASPTPPEPTAEPAPEGRLVGGAELVSRASADMEKIRRGLKEVLARVQDARDEKDLVKLLCADEKLSRLKVLVSVAERADVALAEAVANHDEAAAIESSKIAIARGKADGLRAEAASCIGQLAYEVNEKTSVLVEEAEAPPDLGAADPTARPTARGGPYRTEFGVPADANR